MNRYQSVTGRPLSPQREFGQGEASGQRSSSIIARASHLARTFHLATVGWLVVLAALAGIWWVSLTVVNVRNMGELGLLMVLPVSVYLVYVALTISFCLAIRFTPPRLILLLHVVLLIFMVHGTPNIIYGTVRYSWAWKHIGLIDYIQQYRRVDVTNELLGAYHNWPGFFTVNAFLTEMAGLESSVSYAGWAPVFFNLVFLGAILVIFRASTHDERVIWLGAWLFVLANWVGQDYFSPQAMNYFLHLVVLGSTLWWFRQTKVPSREELQRFVVFDWAILRWIADKVDELLCRVKSSEPFIRVDAKQQRAGVMVLMVFLLATIASSHQLTPFITLVGLSALVVFQRSNARMLPLLAWVISFTWLIYGASVYMGAEVSDLVASMLEVQETLDTGFISLGDASYAQQLIAIMGRGLTAGFWGLALLGAVRRIYNGKWDLSILLLAGSPLLMLAGGSYGGEILFRIYFFTLPFMAFLAAAFFFPRLEKGRSWFTTITLIVVSLAMLVGLGFAYYGKDQQYYFTPEEVAAADYLDTVAPPGALIVEGTRNYPVRFRNHTFGTLHVAFSREPEEGLKEILADPVEVFLRWMTDSSYSASYMIMTRSMKSEVDMTGTMPPGALDAVEDAMIDSPYFKVLYQNSDAIIFVASDAYPELQQYLKTEEESQP